MPKVQAAKPPDPVLEPGPSDARRARDVRVLVVDDQELFRTVARAVVEATPGFVLVGEATGGQEALVAVDRCEPELVLLDVRMPGMDGVEVARRLDISHPELAVILISIDELADLPSAAASPREIPLVRKQDFSSRVLRMIWDVHGR